MKTLLVILALTTTIPVAAQQPTKPTTVIVSTRSVLQDELKPATPKGNEPQVAVHLRTADIADRWWRGELTADERNEISSALVHALGRVGSPPCVAVRIAAGRERGTVSNFIREPAMSSCKD